MKGRYHTVSPRGMEVLNLTRLRLKPLLAIFGASHVHLFYELLQETKFEFDYFLEGFLLHLQFAQYFVFELGLHIYNNEYLQFLRIKVLDSHKFL